MKRFLKLFSGSVACLYGVGCVALTHADEVQEFLRDSVFDWAGFLNEFGLI